MSLSAVKTETRLLLRLAGPLVIGQLLHMGMAFVDIVMIGRLGAQALAAGGLGATLWSFVLVTTMGLMMAISPIVAQLKGAGRMQEIGPIFQQGVWLSLGVGMLAMLVLRSAGVVLVWFAVPTSLVQLSEAYLYAISWGMPAVSLYFAGRFLSEGVGHTRPVMVIQVIALLANVLGNYVLIYGNLGAPALGVAGSGWATCLAMYLNAILIFLYLARAQVYKGYHLFYRFSRPLWREALTILKLSAPIAFMLVTEVGLFAVVALLMGRLGTHAVGAHQIALNYSGLMYMVPLGVSLALTVRIGHAIGAGAFAEVRFRGAIGVWVAVVFMLISAALILLFPEAISGMYTQDVQVQTVAVKLLFMAALFQLSDGLQVTGAGALRGMKDTAIPMLITVIAYWLVGLPAAWLAGIYFDMGPTGLWLGLIIGLTVAGLLLNVRFYRLASNLREA